MPVSSPWLRTCVGTAELRLDSPARSQDKRCVDGDPIDNRSLLAQGILVLLNSKAVIWLVRAAACSTGARRFVGQGGFGSGNA